MSANFNTNVPMSQPPRNLITTQPDPFKSTDMSTTHQVAPRIQNLINQRINQASESPIQNVGTSIANQGHKEPIDKEKAKHIQIKLLNSVQSEQGTFNKQKSPSNQEIGVQFGNNSLGNSSNNEILKKPDSSSQSFSVQVNNNAQNSGVISSPPPPEQAILIDNVAQPILSQLNQVPEEGGFIVEPEVDSIDKIQNFAAGENKGESSQKILRDIVGRLANMGAKDIEIKSELAQDAGGFVVETYYLEKNPGQTFYKMECTYTVTAMGADGIKKEITCKRMVYSSALDEKEALMLAVKYTGMVKELAFVKEDEVNSSGWKYSKAEIDNLMTQRSFNLTITRDASGRATGVTNASAGNLTLKLKDQPYVPREGQEAVADERGAHYKTEAEAMLHAKIKVTKPVESQVSKLTSHQAVQDFIKELNKEAQKDIKDFKELQASFESSKFYGLFKGETKEFKQFLSNLGQIQEIEQQIKDLKEDLGDAEIELRHINLDIKPDAVELQKKKDEISTIKAKLSELESKREEFNNLEIGQNQQMLHTLVSMERLITKMEQRKEHLTDVQQKLNEIRPDLLGFSGFSLQTKPVTGKGLIEDGLKELSKAIDSSKAFVQKIDQKIKDANVSLQIEDENREQIGGDPENEPFIKMEMLQSDES